MLALYNRIRDLILATFPDHDQKPGLDPEQYPSRYECRYVINSPNPFAFALSKTRTDKLFLAFYIPVWSENHLPYLLDRIFDNKGISFTSDGAESFSIQGPRKLYVFHLSNADHTVYDYMPYTEKMLFDTIIASLGTTGSN